MTSLGVWACQWRELRPISFGGAARSTTSTKTQDASDETAGEDDVGFARGRGRGRGRDGSGGYEMVGMDHQDGNV